MTAGSPSSGKPLSDRLGITPGRPGQIVYVAGPTPAGLDELLGGATYRTRLPRQADVSLLFCENRRALDRRLGRVVDSIAVDGMVWVCWPKRSSVAVTDLSEHEVRAAGLSAGMVDVKVVAVDRTWSALKFVRRRTNR